MENIAQSSSTDNKNARGWWAVITLSLATFSVVTTEMLPVGLLNPIRDSFAITTGISGFMMVIPAIIAAFFSPIIVLGAGKRDRKTMLLLLTVFLVIANIACAYSSSIYQLLIARAIVGFCIGGIWAFAGGLAIRLVSKNSVALATSLIFGGVAIASVLGIPLGVVIGNVLGWRGAFIIMALFSLFVLILIFICVPSLPGTTSPSIKKFFTQFNNRELTLGLLITLFLVCAHFMVFTYVRPLLQSSTSISENTLSLLLFAYGVSGIIGNFIFGLQASKRLSLSVSAIIIGLLIVFISFILMTFSLSIATIMMLLWGILYGGISVTFMTWVMSAAPKGIELGSSAYIAIFNFAIAMGAYLGGSIVDSYSIRTTVIVATTFIILAFLCLLLSLLKTKLTSV